MPKNSQINKYSDQDTKRIVNSMNMMPPHNNFIVLTRAGGPCKVCGYGLGSFTSSPKSVLLIRFTSSNLCCISESTMKHHQKLD